MIGEIASLSAACLWAIASVLFARLGRSVQPLVLNLLKCALAGLGLMLIRALLEGALWPTLSFGALSWLTLSGLIGLAIGDTVFFGALQRIGARRTLLITALAPPMTALLAWPILGEPVAPSMALGMALTMGGVVWVIMERTPAPAPSAADPPLSHEGPSVAPADPDTHPSPHATRVGVVLALFAALCQASGNVLTKLGGADTSGLSISIVRLSACVLGLTLLLGAARRLPEVIAPFRRPRTLRRLLTATFIGTFLSLWLLMIGLQHTLAGTAATLAATSPLFVLPIAWRLEGERISPRAILGALVAVIGVALLF